MSTDPVNHLYGTPRPSPDPRIDARPGWMGFVGGALLVVLAASIAMGIWQLLGDRGSQLTIVELREAEQLLAQLGFPPGPVDGDIDDQSRNAIRDFQVTAGIEVDGELDSALLDELRAAKAESTGN